MTARQVRIRTTWESYKRQAIQEAVIRLICREGLKSVTMERVAQEVGIAKGTVYLHYRDKQELLDAVKESALAPIMSKVDEVLRGSDAPDRKLRACAAEYFSYFDEHRDLFRVLIYEREVTRVSGSRYQSDRYRHLIQETARVINEGARSGVLRVVDAHNVAPMSIVSTFGPTIEGMRRRSTAPAGVAPAPTGYLLTHW